MITYECKECGATMERIDDHTLRLSQNAESFLSGDCPSCRRYSEARLSAVGALMAERRARAIYDGIMLPIANATP